MPHVEASLAEDEILFLTKALPQQAAQGALGDGH
jgi:hypothetical protein